MKLHFRRPESIYSRSLSVSSRYFTPRKSGVPLKGINLTLRNSQDKDSPLTLDKTITKVSSTSTLNIQNFDSSELPPKRLFRQYSAFTFNGKDQRSRSLPAFNFDKPFSGFATVSKPYTKLMDYGTSTTKNSNALT